MAGDARRREAFGAEEFEVVGQVAEARGEVIGEAAAGHPAAEAVEVAAVGGEGVGGQAAFGLDVVAEGAGVVGQGGEVGGAVGEHGESFRCGVEASMYYRPNEEDISPQRTQRARREDKRIAFAFLSLRVICGVYFNLSVGADK